MKRQDKYVNKSEINEELRRINGTKDFITPSGKVYKDIGNDILFRRSIFPNKHNGYLYTALQKNNGEMIQRRVHILVAEAFIPNPDNLPIVMHKDNNKANPDINNLKWGTVSENTKQSFDDKLLYNDAGFADSQSIPVCQFDLNCNLLNIFGSVSEAYRVTGITKSTILSQCRHKTKTHPRCGYYFRFLEEFDFDGFVL